MIEHIVVGLIVAAAFASVARRYLMPKTGGKCGSGSADSCSSCNACSTPVTAPEPGRKVIPLRVER